MAKQKQAHASEKFDWPFITGLLVSGFKSIASEQRIEVRPLTILAGANSSGKSSMIQPLLLLKQTLESSFDSGPLVLNGPHVQFTSAKQLFSSGTAGGGSAEIRIGVSLSNGAEVSSYFRSSEGLPLELFQTLTEWQNGSRYLVQSDVSAEDQLTAVHRELVSHLPDDLRMRAKWSVERDRCFLSLHVSVDKPIELRADRLFGVAPHGWVERAIQETIHVPGLRERPERAYPNLFVGSKFLGPFHPYTASVIREWERKEPKKLAALDNNMKALGLTWKVRARAVDDAHVEVVVGRLTKGHSGEKDDVVNIADAGLGVSQALPVLVALGTAERNRLVIIEQPELHLHPRAEVALAEVIVQAANRGVRVILETHSALLLKGVQALVAEGKLDPKHVKLYWFQRARSGSTRVTPADIDDAGRFGDWPEDFAEVELKAESRYLDAAEAAHGKK